VREILEVRSGIANFRSPVIGSAVLRGYVNAAAVTTVVAECIKRGEQEKRADPNLGIIAKELTRFANLERLLPENGRREALQNLYEDIKQVRSIRENPHFWLQYAMARLALGDLPIARRYFEQSYSYARALNQFDTFQIDNHYCRLLLMEAENSTDADVAYKSVIDSLSILKKQVLRENRHYPYRSTWNLDGVSKRHAESWTLDQRNSVVAAARYLIDAAEHLDAQVARSVAVVGGLERLRAVIERLSS
ncbi:MAG TPA: hypothetical protein VM555_11980, partial [Tahibacter sp.]|nr:hypothetical protein [Tahibacter sp.]